MFAPMRFLALHAVENPDRPALITTNGSWTFSELERAVAAVAGRLREQGVAPRMLVATDLDAAEDWIVTLALLRIATRTLSTTGARIPSGIVPDALIARPGARTVGAAITITVDRLWIEQVVTDSESTDTDTVPVVLYPRDDAICRVILTSGTTGTARAAELSLRAIEHRVQRLSSYWTDERPELNLMPLSTTGGFHTALAALRHGTPYVAVDLSQKRWAQVAASAGVQVLCGSPVQVGQALRVLRDSGSSLPDLREVRTAGAAPSDTLLATIAGQLAVPVRGVYGSTEGGGIATRMLRAGEDSADVGQPIEGVTLEIVDESGAATPLGHAGEVRYRGPGLAHGYVIDDERSFRDGWFYPGDRGRFSPVGSLVVEGRTAEIVNVGGVKVDPATVDAVVDGFPGIVDAGTFIIEQVPGVPELGLAVVAEADCDLRALDQLLRQRLPGTHPTVFGHVSVIPRNRMGKVERPRLTAEFRRRLNLD